MTESGCRVRDAVAGCDAASHVDRAFLIDEKDNSYKSDRPKWKTYSSRRYGDILTWYGDLGAMRYMSSTR